MPETLIIFSVSVSDESGKFITLDWPWNIGYENLAELAENVWQSARSIFETEIETKEDIKFIYEQLKKQGLHRFTPKKIRDKTLSELFPKTNLFVYDISAYGDNGIYVET